MLLLESRLPSDRMRWKSGFDSCEPDEVCKASRYYSRHARITVAFNTIYHEVAGGYYFNRHLLVVLQQSLEHIGLWVVLPDVIFQMGIHSYVPTELFGSLDRGQEYKLVSRNAEDRGFLFIWDGDSQGGEWFYDDCEIVDCLLEFNAVESLKQSLRSRCLDLSIPFTEVNTTPNA